MDFLQKILKDKRQEVAKLSVEDRKNQQKGESFYQRVKSSPDRLHIIGEIKRASPSKGDINLEVDIIQQARSYEKSGVSAISVLTDEVFFKGNMADLQAVAEVVTVPVLCKDFIISEKQLIRAKNAGASMVLLIVAALSFEKLQDLYQKARMLDLEVLVEVHNQAEMQCAQQLNAQIIGVNNRDLKTFSVDIQTSIALAQSNPDPVYVSESGFSSKEDAQLVSPYYQAILVGETLMRSGNPKEKILELRVKQNDKN